MAYLSAVSPERIGQHFVVEGDSAVVEKAVRDLCTFAPHNVLRDPPFSRLDLVSCRNLMIYLGVEAQQQLMPVLHYALRPRGYLFIGMAENVTRFEDLFETIDKQHRIFQARDAIPPARCGRCPGRTRRSLQVRASRSGATRRRTPPCGTRSRRRCCPNSRRPTRS